MLNPLEQFSIKTLIPIDFAGVDISFHNSAFTMCIVSLAIAALLYLGTRGKSIIPDHLGALVEILYEMIEGMLQSTAGSNSKKYLPFIFTLFLFILTCNLLGLIPYTFTVTSHVAVTFALAAFIFICVTVLGFYKHGLHYFSLFIPSGTPLAMAPFLFLIELLSYMARPISLSIRLAANMIAGHVVLKVLASLTILSGIFGIFPLALLTLITGFEIFIAVLQAYIFSILTCVYLNDALNLH